MTLFEVGLGRNTEKEFDRLARKSPSQPCHTPSCGGVGGYSLKEEGGGGGIGGGGGKHEDGL